MSIGLGAAVGLWVISGVTFWSAFVVLGLGFRSADEADEARTPAPGGAKSSYAPPRAAREHVLARSRR